MTGQATEHGGGKVRTDDRQWTAGTSASKKKKKKKKSGSAVDTGETWKRTEYCAYTQGRHKERHTLTLYIFKHIH